MEANGDEAHKRQRSKEIKGKGPLNYVTVHVLSVSCWNTCQNLSLFLHAQRSKNETYDKEFYRA